MFSRFQIFTLIILNIFIIATESQVWINEIDYTEEGKQGVELAGPVSQTLEGWSLAVYDENSLDEIHNLNTFILQSVYDFGTDLGGYAFGVLWEEINMPSTKGGVALLDSNSVVVDFVSFGAETLTAVDGPAAGSTATHINAVITEPENSLQLIGVGTTPDELTWVELPCSAGAINVGQAIITNCLDTPVASSPVWYETDPIYNCTWYQTRGRCKDFGLTHVGSDGLVATEACCVCGGGITFAPTTFPSMAPTTPNPTKNPTQRPTDTVAEYVSELTQCQVKNEEYTRTLHGYTSTAAICDDLGFSLICSITPTTSPSSSYPSKVPTDMPSISGPTGVPTVSTPTSEPTLSPSISDPSAAPSDTPHTDAPTNSPSTFPTVSPVTTSPSLPPTFAPSLSQPTVMPSLSPETSQPTTDPTDVPSVSDPTTTPSDQPSLSSPTSNPVIAMIDGFEYLGDGACRADDLSYPLWYFDWSMTYSRESCAALCVEHKDICLGFDFQFNVYSTNTTNTTCALYVSEMKDEIDWRYRSAYNWDETKVLSTTVYDGNDFQRCYRLILTNSPTPDPAIDPTASPSSSPVCSECYDIIPPGSNGEWYDSSGGSRWNCKTYEYRDACQWGDSFRNFGLVANEACCVCGGGSCRGVPSTSPSHEPTSTPSISNPSKFPTQVPVTSSPTQSPSLSPTTPFPTAYPTYSNPSANPSTSPVSSAPSTSPSLAPSTSFPSAMPSASPSTVPSFAPHSSLPTVSPSLDPSKTPTFNPSVTPTNFPTFSDPSTFPSNVPSTEPSMNPTSTRPTTHPATENPTVRPSESPTNSPTVGPTGCPSLSPTLSPTANPSVSPSLCPSTSPTPRVHCVDFVPEGYDQWYDAANLKYGCDYYETQQIQFDLMEIDLDICESFSFTYEYFGHNALSACCTCGGGITAEPTQIPSVLPSLGNPTPAPVTSLPTKRPSTAPLTTAPSVVPSENPSTQPTDLPTVSDPTTTPSTSPEVSEPTGTPSSMPTISTPTSTPTNAPTNSDPTIAPSAEPTISSPTSGPTRSPFSTPPPSTTPTRTPSGDPTAGPTCGCNDLRPPGAPNGVWHDSNGERFGCFFYEIEPTLCEHASDYTNFGVDASTVCCACGGGSCYVPTIAPTIGPSQVPTISAPTAIPSTSPSYKPSQSPTSHPVTTVPTSSPSAFPTTTPSNVPSVTPSIAPTSSVPTAHPSAMPSTSPSGYPSSTPSSMPTSSRPTTHPSSTPTVMPSDFPSTEPTQAPTSSRPTLTPSVTPSYGPTRTPSRTPSRQPASATPTQPPSVSPTFMPSTQPTTFPSFSPSYSDPTVAPSTSPSVSPSVAPSVKPSLSPSVGPSDFPTYSSPTTTPSLDPSNAPSDMPSTEPSLSPETSDPTKFPSVSPSNDPTTEPSLMPSSSLPSFSPETSLPSVSPTLYPTNSEPTGHPTTSLPTMQPSDAPTTDPTNLPSTSPTLRVHCLDILLDDGSAWYDSGRPPFYCSDYAHSKAIGRDICHDSPEYYENFGHTSETACCACGGGLTSRPTLSPSSSPLTSAPVCSPTRTPNAGPTKTPSATPSLSPTTTIPSASPFTSPTSTPSKHPSLVPSVLPSMSPALSPFPDIVTTSPSTSPSSSPITSMPTLSPTKLPTVTQPSSVPSTSPSLKPNTSAPSTSIPTANPTLFPSVNPSGVPSAEPSIAPSKETTFKPNERPSTSPSLTPSRSCKDLIPPGADRWYDIDGPRYSCGYYTPDRCLNFGNMYANFGLVANQACCSCGGGSFFTPTYEPSVTPTVAPSSSPSTNPTSSVPTSSPSIMPTVSDPTAMPTEEPTISDPTVTPTQSPSISNPTTNPTSLPTVSEPTGAPTFSDPSGAPTSSPVTANPTSSPSMEPTFSDPTSTPSKEPTLSTPTSSPSTAPSRGPTMAPVIPTCEEKITSYLSWLDTCESDLLLQQAELNSCLNRTVDMDVCEDIEDDLETCQNTTSGLESRLSRVEGDDLSLCAGELDVQILRTDYDFFSGSYSLNSSTSYVNSGYTLFTDDNIVWQISNGVATLTSESEETSLYPPTFDHWVDDSSSIVVVHIECASSRRFLTDERADTCPYLSVNAYHSDFNALNGAFQLTNDELPYTNGDYSLDYDEDSGIWTLDDLSISSTSYLPPSSGNWRTSAGELVIVATECRTTESTITYNECMTSVDRATTELQNCYTALESLSSDIGECYSNCEQTQTEGAECLANLNIPETRAEYIDVPTVTTGEEVNWWYMDKFREAGVSEDFLSNLKYFENEFVYDNGDGSFTKTCVAYSTSATSSCDNTALVCSGSGGTQYGWPGSMVSRLNAVETAADHVHPDCPISACETLSTDVANALQQLGIDDQNLCQMNDAFYSITTKQYVFTCIASGEQNELCPNNELVCSGTNTDGMKIFGEIEQQARLVETALNSSSGRYPDCPNF